MTGYVIEYNHAAQRGTIQPTDGASRVAFHTPDILPGDRPHLHAGIGVAFELANTSAGSEATEIRVLQPDTRCPCGSGATFGECHGAQEVRRVLTTRL